MLTEEDSCKEQLQDILDFYDFCKVKNKSYSLIGNNEITNLIMNVKPLINLYTNKDEFLKDAGRIFNLIKENEK